jgi:hypothetical protein
MDCFHYIVGDIHGCYLELCALEQQLQAHSLRYGRTPYVISVGDLIDRGPQSLEVVQHFLQGSRAGTHFAVAGNHEGCFFDLLFHFAPHLFTSPEYAGLPHFALGCDFLYTPEYAKRYPLFEDFVSHLKSSWILQGGESTLRSFGLDARAPQSWFVDAEVFTYLYHLPLFWEGAGVVVTHALALEESVEVMKSFLAGQQNIRSSEVLGAIEDITWSRTVPRKPRFPGRIHVSGHTPQQTPTVLHQGATILLDTGCAYGSNLTAWCVQTKEFLSVRALEYGKS